MKNILHILAFVLFSIFINAQKKTEQQVKVEITKIGGEIITGYVDRLKIPQISTFQEMVNNNNGSIFNSKTTIDFKSSVNDEPQKLSVSEISKIKFLDKFDDEILAVENLRLMKFNIRNQIEDTKKYISLPLLYDGKIDIYGYSTLYCYVPSGGKLKSDGSNGTGCTNVSTFFLKNNKENFVISPVDINVFNVSQSFDRFVAAFKLVGEDCPIFAKYLDDFRIKMEDKEFQIKLRKELINYKKQVEKDSKEIDKNERKKYVGVRMLQYEMQLYLGIIKEYEKNCQ